LDTNRGLGFSVVKSRTLPQEKHGVFQPGDSAVRLRVRLLSVF